MPSAYPPNLPPYWLVQLKAAWMLLQKQSSGLPPERTEWSGARRGFHSCAQCTLTQCAHGHPESRVLFLCSVFRDRVSLCSPGCPGTHSVDQAGLELRNPPASASQVLGLKVCATTAQHLFAFIHSFTHSFFFLWTKCSLCSPGWSWNSLCRSS